MRKNSNVTVIFNIWKRNYLNEQLAAVLSQSLKPEHFWINQNKSHVDLTPLLRRYSFLQRVHSDMDLKYYARFSIGIFCPTDYIWIIDDDVIPSKYWLEGCIELCESSNSIVCSSGRIIPPGNYYPEQILNQSYLEKYFIGDAAADKLSNSCHDTTKVDFGCNSWVFKRDWLKHFWRTWPQTLETGEDIHLSATCNIHGMIETVVPRQLSQTFCGNLKRSYGFDRHASFLRTGFLEQRAQVIQYLVEEHNWTPQNWL